MTERLRKRQSLIEGTEAAATRRGMIKAGVIAALASAGTARAAQGSETEGPFVEHRLALQLSDGDATKRALVLSVANNILKEYGLDRVAIEVVAFGPGIDLLRENAPERTGVDSLVSQGVRFDFCMNTVETIERETGEKVALNPHARPVRAGVAQLLALAEHGYTVVRP